MEKQRATSLRELFFSFEGRIGRAQYWLYCGLILNLILVFAMAIGYAIAGNKGTEAGYFVGILLIIWSILAFNVKRCHDRGRSGLFLLVSLIPLINIWYYVEMLFLPSANSEKSITSLNLS